MLFCNLFVPTSFGSIFVLVDSEKKFAYRLLYLFYWVPVIIEGDCCL